ncbi:MAG: metalloprotease PmbA [Methylococcaceae bacterium]|nr:metalloprotease PmbA [Methylococcaceae bacterium]
MQTSEQIDPLKNLVQDGLDEAKKQGASAAEVGLSTGNGLSVSARLGDVETIEHDCNQGFGLTVYFGKRKGSASSTDLSPNSIKETVRAACSIATFSSEDDFAGLPDPEMLATEFPDLDSNHPWAIDAEQAIKLAVECEDAARSYHKEISNSDGATVNSHQGIKILGNSLGFLHGYQSTRHSLSCSVIAQRGEEMQTNYWYSVARNANGLESAQQIGQKAAERALKRLGSQSITTRTAPVLYVPELASGLISSLMGAISGGSLYRKSTFLLDSLDTQIMPDFIRIHEQPYLKNALGSAAYDGEGVATKTRDIVSEGILRSYLLSTYSARKLGMKSTGNAAGVHNLSIDSSDNDFNAMLKKLDTGLLVTELMGQGVNSMTGDYSRGAAGFWVENGVILHPVEEITIAGNLKDMLRNLVAVGNDVDYRGNIHSGSILIEQMSIAA